MRTLLQIKKHSARYSAQGRSPKRQCQTLGGVDGCRGCGACLAAATVIIEGQKPDSLDSAAGDSFA